MAKKLYEEASVQAIADAIRNKNSSAATYKIADMAQAILDIPSGGSSDPTLWCGGKNPKLIQTFSTVFNIANDTTFLSKTPSTSNQNIVSAGSRSFTCSGLDAASYDYIVFNDIIVPHVYTSQPNYTHVIATANRMIFRIRKPANTYEFVKHLDTPTLYYQSADGATKSYYNSTSYGIGFNSQLPSATTQNIICITPAVSMRSNNNYMNNSSWQSFDAASTNCYMRWQIFQVDKPDQTNLAIELVRQDIQDGDGTMADNFILADSI